MAKYVDNMNRPVVMGLFKEHARPDAVFKPIYTIPEWKEVYMKHSDVTEYGPAMELLEDWEHWTIVREHPIMKKHIDAWQKEVEVKLRSEAVKQMMKHSKGQHGAVAAKWIAEGGYKPKDLRSKASRQQEESIRKEVDKQVSADVIRLGLKVVGAE